MALWSVYREPNLFGFGAADTLWGGNCYLDQIQHIFPAEQAYIEFALK